MRGVSSSLRLPEYESCGEAGVPGRLYLRRRGPACFDLHVVEHAGPRWREGLGLRDYLRATPGEAGRYQQAKERALAGSATLLGYSQAKARILEELLARVCE